MHDIIQQVQGFLVQFLAIVLSEYYVSEKNWYWTEISLTELTLNQTELEMCEPESNR